MTKSDLEAERKRALDFIEYATATLKGPMSNLSRALMVADRTDAREHLAKTEADLAAIA